jgi:superfamily II DNA/RNA helicase
MLFSATLDGGVDVLVKRFMHKPVTHHVDSASEAPIEMSHHVLHVRHDDRFPVLVDLVAAPGRSVVFTRTKRRAKTLTRQLIAAGVPAVELHGNLAQNARNRNLSAFSDGSAATLVATDIAARGIHVDDVALVIHADPPVEHKAYLHRSGRTARAGNVGTVITLMTDDQQGDVRDLTRKAGIRPTTTKARPGDAVLAQLAPGERVFVAPSEMPAVTEPTAPQQGGRSRSAAGTGGGGGARGRGRSAGTHATAATHEQGGQAGGGRSQAGRGGQGRRAGQTQNAPAQSGRTTTGQARSRRGGTGSTPIHTSSSPGASGSSTGGAAAFSSGTRVGGRRGSH